MPSISHQALVTLVRDNPSLGAYLFEAATGQKLPSGSELQLTSAQFTDLQPPEYSSDAAYVIRYPSAKGGSNVAGGGAVIFEAQLTRDEDKRGAWFRYSAAMYSQRRSPVTVIVLAVSDAMARWCARPLSYDHVGRNIFRPEVLGPAQLPRITDASQAERLPALAVLSVAAHGNEDGGEEVALAALGACRRLDKERGTQYADFVLSWLSDAARLALEELMAQNNYEYQSDFAKSYFAQGREEGLEAGLEAGREEGLEAGREEGLEAGRESGLLSGIEVICKLLAVELNSERRQLLEQSSVEELESLLETLSAKRRWPD